MAERRKKRKREETKPTDPPMTPMIDIIFQLLIFFLLTLKIKEVEGKLLNELPRDKGQQSTSVPSPEKQEIRITLCTVDDSNDEFMRRVARHTNNKGRHEAELEKDEQEELRKTETGHNQKSRLDKPHIILNDICTAFVDKNPMGKLYKTRICRYKDHREGVTLSEQERIDENDKRYHDIAAKTKELYDLTPSSRDASKRAPIIIDTDSATPYEHIIGVVNALKEVGIENVEFVANARHSKYYGAQSKGQFDTYRGDVK